MRRKRFWLQVLIVVVVALVGGGVFFVDSAHGPRPEPAPVAQVAPEPAMDREVVRKLVTSAHGVLNQGGVCSSFEYFASGLPVPVPSAKDWAEVMSLYHSAKAGLLAWTQENRDRIPASALQEMERAVKEIRIHRPPTFEEPEIAVRGVGVLSEDLAGKPMIRVGAGFVRLAHENAARAKFELARLVAQTWAPCALEKAKIESPWAPLLGCMGVDASVKCQGSAFSEAGWAVSSVIAAKVAPPGCELPALVGSEKGVCGSGASLPSTRSALQPLPGSGIQEARR